MKRKIIAVLIVCFIFVFSNNVKAANGNEFEEFNFKSYNKYTINDSSKVEFKTWKSTPSSEDALLKLKNLNKDYFYVLTTLTDDGGGSSLIGADDCMGTSSPIYNNLELFYGSYDVVHDYYGMDFKNTTTTFIRNDLNRDYCMTLFYNLEEIQFFGSGWKLYDTFGNNIVLYEFSLSHNLSNSLVSIDDMSPVVNGLNYFYIVDIDRPELFCDIISNIKITDNIDGDITNKALYNTEYPKDNNFTELRVKNYVVNSSISDSFGNTTTFNFAIKVMDLADPIISGDQLYTYKSYSGSDAQTIKALLTAHDNYDGDVTNKITISDDGFSENKDKVGTYYVTYSVSDNSQNITYFTVSVVVTDGKAPEITGDDLISSDKLLTDAEILSYFTAVDDVDGDITNKIYIKSNDCPGMIKGTYQIVIEVKDNGNNITTKYVGYNIYDNAAPVYWISDMIQVSSDVILTESQIVKILIEMGKATNNDSIVLETNYFDNSNVKGEYEIIARCTNEFGITRNEKILIGVFGKKENIKEDMPETRNEVDEKEDKTKHTLLIGSTIILSSLGILVFYLKRKQNN